MAPYLFEQKLNFHPLSSNEPGPWIGQSILSCTVIFSVITQCTGFLWIRNVPTLFKHFVPSPWHCLERFWIPGMVGRHGCHSRTVIGLLIAGPDPIMVQHPQFIWQTISQCPTTRDWNTPALISSTLMVNCDLWNYEPNKKPSCKKIIVMYFNIKMRKLLITMNLLYNKIINLNVKLSLPKAEIPVHKILSMYCNTHILPAWFLENKL